MSKSVAKAPRVGIGREKKRGISTIFLARFGAIRAFATDLDKRRRRGLPGGVPRAGRRPRRGFGPDWSSPARADPAALTGQGGGSGPAPPARADRATPAPRPGA